MTVTNPGVEETAPLVGADQRSSEALSRGDLSDWVDLMEAVEALCPVWPAVALQPGRIFLI